MARWSDIRRRSAIGRVRHRRFHCKYTLAYLSVCIIYYMNIYLQWNLNKRQVGTSTMSIIRRLSFIGNYLPKIPYFT